MKSEEEIKALLEHMLNHPSFKSGDLSESTMKDTIGRINALKWVLEIKK